jgi:EAL and modified HD-GYP domain-containing signal transduction protein
LTPPASDSIQEAAELRYVVRQPILDTHSRLHGYELLFQLSAEGAAGGYGAHAVRAILDDTLLFGLDRLTNGVPAFINCTAEALTEELVSVLPPTKAVLEIPEQLETSPKLVGACRRLKEAGFRLALVDFTWGPMPHLLLQTVDYVKVNLTHLDRSGRERLRLAIEGTSVVMIADRVDTQETYQSARAEGFTLFQGCYFCCPELMRNTKVPSNRASHIELLRLLRSDPLDLKRLNRLSSETRLSSTACSDWLTRHSGRFARKYTRSNRQLWCLVRRHSDGLPCSQC